ncbi:MAG TPA: RsmE family RNA methyltransferase [Candidatus Angelobacter sp.]|nr:RsmE family RNA methyltransferase [Candidatus Angelobacter sp.]
MTRRRWIADRVEGDRAFLLDQNAAHLFRVLRVKPGQEFEVVAGGALRLGTVVFAAEHQVEFHLGPEIASAALPEIAVYLSIFKFDCMEWALEKLTELGVAKILPVIAQRSGQHLVKAAPTRLARWRKIVHEAAQQSRRIAPPEISEPSTLKKVITAATGSRIVLSETEGTVSLSAALTECVPPLSLAFGPEGGWSQDEIKMFHDAGWKSASLGHTILRAETAAIAAVAVVMAELAEQ